MMKRITAIAVVATSAVLLSGCGTFMMRVVDAKAPREFLYPATQADVKMMKWFVKPDGTIITSKSYVGATLCVIDMPISAVFDTVLLPIDLLQRHDYRTRQAAMQAKTNQQEKAGSNQAAQATAPNVADPGR